MAFAFVIVSVLVASAACSSHGYLSDGKRKKLISEDLKARRSYIRQEALIRLSETNDFALEKVIVAFLEDPAPVCRSAAATGLRRVGTRKSIPAVAKALKENGEYPLVRCDLAMTYAILAQEDAVSELARLLAEDPNPMVRRTAAEAMAVTGSTKCVKPLLDAMASRDDNIRMASWQSLKSLTGMKDLPPEPRYWVAKLPPTLMGEAPQAQDKPAQ